MPAASMADNERRTLWTPTAEMVESCQMTRFRETVSSTYSLDIKTYEELWEWSVDRIEEFWATVWNFCGIKSSKPWTQILPPGATVDSIPEWFSGSRLNYAENLLEGGGDPAKKAIIFADERWNADGIDCSMTLGEVKRKVGKLSNALRQKGVGRGEVVAMYAPNIPETVIFTLASAAIGAIITSVSPDFGTAAVLDRFSQTKPKLLLTANAAIYNGKVHGQWGKVSEVVRQCPSIESIIWVNYIPSTEPNDINRLTDLSEFEEFISGQTEEIVYEQLPFNHPLFILYSSGTTGKPKCLVHSAGGTLIQHLKEHKLHANLAPDDILLQYTTVGWMMWQWQLSAMATGACLVLYDGSPFKPSQDHLLRILRHYNVTAFGTGAKYLQKLEETETTIPIPSLRLLFSTGSPLPAKTFDWIADHFNVQIASITGGTDIISLFAGGNPLLPVHSGFIQCRCLGMAIHAYDSNGKSVMDEPGDLVCTRPFPSQPVLFWGDTDGTAYRKAYFSSPWPHVWHHGDFIQIDSRTGGILMLGRSDGTLNPAGVRFGSADLYAITTGAEFRDQIIDSLAVGVQPPGELDEHVVLFIQLSKELTPPELDDLAARLKSAIRSSLSPRHVPSLILPCPEIPYTLNGKKVEVAVKRILNGSPDTNTASLANPQALDFFRNLTLSL